MRWPLVTVGLSACILEFGIDPIDPPDPPRSLVAVEDVFVQEPLPAVDLLFVVDDTASMEQEQGALAEQFSTLTARLDSEGVAWQIGVTSTDMLSPDSGALRGAPYVLTPSTPDAQAAFDAAVHVGIEGLGPEAGLAAAVRALDLSVPGDANAGFRRPGAILHVVFVSDADDQSDAWLGPDPVGAFLDRMAQEAMDGVPAVASAVVGDVPSGCSSALGSAQPGFRYADAAESGGSAVSICDADFSQLTDAIGSVSVAYPSAFALSRVPATSTVQVELDGVGSVEGWVLELDPPTVVFAAPPAPATHIAVRYLVDNL